MAATLFLLTTSAAIATYALIALARPVLIRYALAHPNHRSSHKIPTPQWGGIFVVATTVIASLLFSLHLGIAGGIALALLAAVMLALIGAIDDVRTLQVFTRLGLQAVAVAVLVAALPAELRIIPALPWWVERCAIQLAILWFVNLVNFMDGLDWMTISEVVPVAGALAAFGLMGALPREATAVAFALCGAMVGFAPFNRPVARLFLGDVGSLPIGLLLGWLLVLLAGNGHLAAALLLPLYYLADSTITLLRRLANGEQIMKAHRSHYYQRATSGGFTVYAIVGRVFLLNCALIILATVTLLKPSTAWQIGALAAGCILVGLLLARFERGNR